MKLIGCMLTRNEAHVLPTTLPPLVSLCDHVIISDQHSTDETKAVIKRQGSQVTLINNNHQVLDSGGFDIERAALLEVARSFRGNNLLLFIDADEILPPLMACNIKDYIERRYSAGAAFEMRFLNIWKRPHQYKNNPRKYRSICSWPLIWDDRKCTYPTSHKNVHIDRLPQTPIRHYLHDFVMIHLHWLFWEKARWKQVWYQVIEFIHCAFNPTAILAITGFYYDTALRAGTLTRSLPPKLQVGWNIDHLTPPYNWCQKDVLGYFNEYGIEKFEPLDIWYLPELWELFVQECGREPQSMLHTLSPLQWVHFMHSHYSWIIKEHLRMQRKFWKSQLRKIVH